MHPETPGGLSASRAEPAVYFIGSAPGKVTPDFFDLAGPIFARHGIEAQYFPDPNLFSRTIESRRIDPGRTCIAVLVYHEERGLADGEEMQRTCDRLLRRCHVIHPISTGRIIGNKIASNRALTAAGVLCPPLIEGTRHDKKVFQNAIAASQHPVAVRLPGQSLDPGMYNTEFIDTRYQFAGRAYYTTARAMCVGGLMTSVMLRFRDAQEHDPSVHDRNTPLMPALINHYWFDRVLPNHESLMAACRRIGEVFGLGFYAHDFGLCAETSRWFLLESGIKLHERTWANHVHDIAAAIVLDSSHPVIMTKMIYAFISHVRKAAPLTGRSDG